MDNLSDTDTFDWLASIWLIGAFVHDLWFAAGGAIFACSIAGAGDSRPPSAFFVALEEVTELYPIDAVIFALRRPRGACV